MPKKRNLTDRDVARAAFHTLKDEGLLLPQSADDVTALEEEFGTYPKGKMNAADALKVARGDAPPPKIIPPAPFNELKGKIKEELGLAARKGSDIPADMWARMKADRKKAQDGQPRKTS
jgi:hypothetical protein